MKLQLDVLFSEIDRLHKLHGSKNLVSIYGGGCIRDPKLFLLFMNPTGRNITATESWNGIRAPWIGTKNVWKLLYKLKLISLEEFNKTQKFKPNEWDEEFAYEIYETLSRKKVYITNLAKCTQDDARPLSNKIFKEYLEIIYKELSLLSPQYIISFGNQVSTVLLKKPIKVSDYVDKHEYLEIGNKKMKVYPTYYPVGQGMRNMDKAVSQISNLL